ncbi:type II toxin-antitoxin system RelE/ParE family toxin [Marinicella rhabdoformis]|uniref:type II toxin-antitoxin system RelE/ParE family toxin n=1 Tax=Marinicella rhabdoformis TaxID=2580566 RepID=UPI0012AEDB3C|nr:type II toxin-antitoxin system RelE/ParE family toxin [Marinicella rhabdoformis]
MSQFILSGSARSDLKSIASYTQKTWGAQQRRLYLKEIDESFHWIAENPKAGHPCNEVSHGLRKQPSGQHIIYYETQQHHIFIIRVLHKSMDVSLHFK